MAQVKRNLQRDLKHDSFLTETSSSEVRPEFRRPYPAAPPLAPLQLQVTQRKVLLHTPSASESFATSVNVPTASAVAKRKILLPTPNADITTVQSSTTSLPSSSTSTAWSKSDGGGGTPSQQQQPRISSLTRGGGQFNSSDRFVIYIHRVICMYFKQ